MSIPWDTSLPPALNELHQLEFDYADGDGIDYEPFTEFFSSEENADWIKAWTGNSALDGSEFRIFGQDGTGGYAAFWVIDSTDSITNQPIVFFGSEGDKGVVAANFNEFLWLLAGGVGPYEAITYPRSAPEPNADFTRFAEKHSSAGPLLPNEVLDRANEKFPHFSDWIDSLCR